MYKINKHSAIVNSSQKLQKLSLPHKFYLRTATDSVPRDFVSGYLFMPFKSLNHIIQLDGEWSHTLYRPYK